MAHSLDRMKVNGMSEEEANSGYASGADISASQNLMSKLHGIPLLVRDNIATDPKLSMLTTAGSHGLVNSIPGEDATVIAKLHEAGVIIFEKRRCASFAMIDHQTPTPVEA
ncbi:hypothetical protein QFC19_008923 [Naganishia cerealis]|uniref:Uncharacterized protein n=1 Tax=Naganishia cerealis TaxID=610337 RepID=A0ACC2UY41_9TREE|nr:hypothetical protein QFC19_008923 [Naganishia cerealis]